MFADRLLFQGASPEASQRVHVSVDRLGDLPVEEGNADCCFLFSMGDSEYEIAQLVRSVLAREFGAAGSLDSILLTGRRGAGKLGDE